MPSRRKPRWFLAFLAGVDVAALLLAFGVATYVRFGIDFFASDESPFDLGHYSKAIVAMVFLLLAFFWLHGLYNWENLLAGAREYTLALNSCTYGVVAAMLVSFVLGGLPVISRGWILAFWVLSVALVGLGRFCCRRVAYGLRRRGRFVVGVVIAGASRHSTAIARQLRATYHSGFAIAGFLDDYLPVGAEPEPGMPVLGRPQNAARILEQTGAQELIIVPSALSWDSQRRLLELAAAADRGISVHVAPSFYDLVTFGVRPKIIGNVPLAALDRNWLSGLDGALKCLLDYVVSVPLLLALGPLALALVLARRGKVSPVIERIPVYGQHGRRLELWAFHRGIARSLLIRGLPALPQVLMRRFSLVGPRPLEARPGVDARARSSLLLSVKPGLTGPWRLVAAEDAVPAADAFYVRNYTIWADLQILFQSGWRLLAEALRSGAGPAAAPVRRWRPGQPLGLAQAEQAIPLDPPRGPQLSEP